MFTVYDTICEILSEQLEIPLDEITAESKLRDDLSADSLDLIDLAMTLEDELCGLPAFFIKRLWFGSVCESNNGKKIDEI